MKTWLGLIFIVFLLGGCATLDSMKKDIQGFLCPECKPVVVEKTIPCPEPTPTPVEEPRKKNFKNKK